VVDALAAAVASVSAFGCEFPVTSWFGEDVLYLAPRPDEPFRALTRAVCAAFPGYLPYGGAFADTIPHLTVGERQRGGSAGRAWETLLSPVDKRSRGVGVLEMAREPTVENWALRAPAVFAAAEAGSGRAAAVIEEAAAELAALVRRLRARGAVGTAVVAGGSVVTRQPVLARALEAQLRLVDAELELRVLAEEPVTGALVLARRLLGSSLAK